jgi:hypothetical protein
MKDKQKATEAKATRGKAVATKAMFGKSMGKRLHDLPESSEESDSETETEFKSEDEYSPPLVKKAKINKAGAKKWARPKQPIRAKTKEIVAHQPRPGYESWPLPFDLNVAQLAILASS